MNRQFLRAAVPHSKAEIKACVANVEAMFVLSGAASHLDPKILLAVVLFEQASPISEPSHQRLVGQEQVSA